MWEGPPAEKSERTFRPLAVASRGKNDGDRDQGGRVIECLFVGEHLAGSTARLIYSPGS